MTPRMTPRWPTGTGWPGRRRSASTRTTTCGWPPPTRSRVHRGLLARPRTAGARHGRRADGGRETVAVLPFLRLPAGEAVDPVVSLRAPAAHPVVREPGAARPVRRLRHRAARGRLR